MIGASINATRRIMDHTKNPQGPIKALIVDDSREMRRSLRSLLEAQTGLEVVGTADDGAQAVELARRQAPDLVVVDLQMPGLSGLDVLSGLREASNKTRVILVSIHDSPAVRRECEQAGVDAFIPKTELFRELPTTLARLFSIPHEPAMRPTPESPPSSSARI
jgi:two-component system, NarL family, response regulator DesR